MKITVNTVPHAVHDYAVMSFQPECWTDRLILNVLKNQALEHNAAYFDFTGWESEPPGTSFKLVLNP